MNRTEHLFIILSEECAEVSQRVSKALRFGLTEVQPGQPYDNAERLSHELADLLGVMNMLVAEMSIPHPSPTRVAAKRAKVEKYVLYSRTCGTLEPVQCPGPHCLLCNGEACDLCGAGLSTDIDRPRCEHDVLERHQTANTNLAVTTSREEKP